MSTLRLLFTGPFVAALFVTAPAYAGVGASGCDDLGGIAPTPRVDFQSQIQPILDECASCHGESGPAGLDLRAGASFDSLVGVISTTNSSRLRVEPFAPDASTLFLAVSCDSPGGPGFRMPGTDLQQRALIRDWIEQGALAEARGASDAVAVPVGGFAPRALLAILLLLTGMMLTRTPRT